METDFNDVQRTAQLRVDSESIKLIKNSKGYTWEIKILSLDVKRLQEIDVLMHNTFGGSTQ